MRSYTSLNSATQMQKLTVNSLQVGKPAKAKQGTGATSPKISNPFLSHN